MLQNTRTVRVLYAVNLHRLGVILVCNARSNFLREIPRWRRRLRTPSVPSVVVCRLFACSSSLSFITKWDGRVNLKRFDLESPNLTMASGSSSSTTTPDMTSLAASGWLPIGYEYWLQVPKSCLLSMCVINGLGWEFGTKLTRELLIVLVIIQLIRIGTRIVLWWRYEQHTVSGISFNWCALLFSYRLEHSMLSAFVVVK